jgi:hypothetical protein
MVVPSCFYFTESDRVLSTALSAAGHLGILRNSALKRTGRFPLFWLNETALIAF